MMNVLFVSSGNSKEGISPIIRNQGESLEKSGVNVAYFAIKGKGFRGYLKNVKVLRKFLKDHNFNFIHAHYSMSAFVASLAGAKPLIVSLMGSDVKSEKLFKIFIHLFNKFSWKKIIVKSEDMKTSLGIKNANIIPNGVDITLFKPLNQSDCKKELKWDLNKKQVLFAANPNNYVKNYPLASQSFSLLDNPNYELKDLVGIPNKQIPLYMNAADLVILTSFWEGSPNVIKEAMACNRPIICTDVGDVSVLFDNVEGCHIIKENNKEELAAMIEHSLNNYSFSDGRKKLKLMKLDSENVAMELIKLYQEI